ncbi:Frag1/DRAM/Sfk1 [Auriculariales sp. MPI-PUGE-AT-0066]|nr:Frag1/DRAM/Sfk1 [Auriculariales sp. MPI-PUGE-AT-0066]
MTAWNGVGHRWLLSFIPLFASIIWFGGLLAMLIVWLARGQPYYESMSEDQTKAFISDIGATDIKPLFITICAVTSIGLLLALICQLWLRRSERALAHERRRQRVLNTLSIVFSAIGAAALILLSVFDTVRYPTMHRLFLFIFIVGVVLSAIFTVFEFRSLSRSYPSERSIRRAFWMKNVLLILLAPAIIAFLVCLAVDIDIAAVLEWIIAFLFTFYLLTFWQDLLIRTEEVVGETSPSSPTNIDLGEVTSTA